MANKAKQTNDLDFELGFSQLLDNVVHEHSYIPVGEEKEIINKTGTRFLSELAYDMWYKVRSAEAIISKNNDNIAFRAWKAKENGTPNDDDPKVEEYQRYMKQAEARKALAKFIFDQLEQGFVAIHGRVSERQDWETVKEERQKFKRKSA